MKDIKLYSFDKHKLNPKLCLSIEFIRIDLHILECFALFQLFLNEIVESKDYFYSCLNKKKKSTLYETLDIIKYDIEDLLK